LDGRVAIVTGAGQGLGRSHALQLSALGAKVVVNDLGTDVHGQGADRQPAEDVVAQITSAGGDGVASFHDVSDWEQAQSLIELAVTTFGDLHVLVNNAGVLRDGTLANLSECDWDTVVRVHLKGHAAPTRHAVKYWRDQAKSGRKADRSVVMTTSIAGFSGNFGQVNYSSAKLAVLALSAVVNLEAGRYGVRANAVSPGAATRMVGETPRAREAADEFRKSFGSSSFDPLDPANVSGLIAWLADARCPAAAQVFHITGDNLVISSLPRPVHRLSADKRAWTPAMLDEVLVPWLVEPVSLQAWNLQSHEPG
jgi:NAD(P)-dependent dehydrogenase (short-subunit alcohol dehydrogenase family)